MSIGKLISTEVSKTLKNRYSCQSAHNIKELGMFVLIKQLLCYNMVVP